MEYLEEVISPTTKTFSLVERTGKKRSGLLTMTGGDDFLGFGAVKLRHKARFRFPSFTAAGCSKVGTMQRRGILVRCVCEECVYEVRERGD